MNKKSQRYLIFGLAIALLAVGCEIPQIKQGSSEKLSPAGRSVPVADVGMYTDYQIPAADKPNVLSATIDINIKQIGDLTGPGILFASMQYNLGPFFTEIGTGNTKIDGGHLGFQYLNLTSPNKVKQINDGVYLTEYTDPNYRYTPFFNNGPYPNSETNDTTGNQPYYLPWINETILIDHFAYQTYTQVYEINATNANSNLYFDFQNDHWYRYIIKRGALYQGFWEWKGSILDIQSGVEHPLGTIYTKASYVDSFSVWEETYFSDGRIFNVQWKNPRYTLADGTVKVTSKDNIYVSVNNNLNSVVIAPTEAEWLSDEHTLWHLNGLSIPANPYSVILPGSNYVPVIGTSTTTTTTNPPVTTTTSSTTTTSTTTTTISGSGSQYEIVSKYSGLAIKSDSYAGSSIYNSTYTGATIQKWILTQVGSYYRFVNLQTNFALRAGQYGNVTTAVIGSGDEQLFSISDAGNGYSYISLKSFPGYRWHIADVFSGNVVTVEAAGADDKYKFSLINLSGGTTTTTTSTTTTPPPTTTTSTTTTIAPVTTTSTTTTTTSTTTTLPPVTTTTSTTTTVANGGTIANGTYQIVNKASNHAQQSDSYAGSSIYNAVYTGAANQKWVFTKVGAYYKISSVLNGLFLRDGIYDNVKTEAGDNGDDELFTITSAGGGYYYITLKLNANRYWKSQDRYDGNPTRDEDFSASNDLYLWTFLAP